MLSHIYKRKHSHFKETHRASHLARSKKTGKILIAERSHIKYGIAIFMISDLNVNGVSVWEQDNIEQISIDMPGVVVHCMYKAPNEKCVLPAIGYGNRPHIVIGDFYSQIITWGYTTTDNNGEAIEQWAYAFNS